MPPRKAAAAPKKAAGAAKKKKTASGYRMPDHLPEGTTLNDLMKKQWTLGKSIGIGGFGEIYLAAEGNNKAEGDKAKYVVKIEPKENGPLFVEMHFYIQVGTAEHVKKWGQPVNIPLLRGQGSYNHKDDVYRFLVIDRLGVDLDKTFENGKNPLADSLIGTLAVQIISSLQYIHSRGYTHNDVKAANLLTGLNQDSGRIYLVDFGLCVKYIKPDGHKEYKADPRKAHDGTIEYLSRDAHIGCTGRRSDLEVLAYNLFHWKTGTLPWISKLANVKSVEQEKCKFMSGLPATGSHLPKSVQNLFNYVASLDFTDEPDYDKCRGFFKAEVKQSGGKINLSTASPQKPRKSGASPTKPTAPGRGRKKPAPPHSLSQSSVEEEVEESIEEDTDSDADMFSPSPQKLRETPKLRGTPRGTSRSRATPKGTPRGTPRGTTRGTPKGAVDGGVAKVTKYKEAGCQTSPGFVSKVRAERKAGISAGFSGEASSSPVQRKQSAAAKPKSKPATVDSPKRKIAKQKPEKNEDDGNFGLDNPTPAMLEILKRKKETEVLKAAKKRKK